MLPFANSATPLNPPQTRNTNCRQSKKRHHLLSLSAQIRLIDGFSLNEDISYPNSKDFLSGDTHYQVVVRIFSQWALGLSQWVWSIRPQKLILVGDVLRITLVTCAFGYSSLEFTIFAYFFKGWRP